MPRYHSLENYYATQYLLENDASMQQQVQPQNPQQQGAEQGMTDAPQQGNLEDYNLRRAVLKLQEWVMYIDDKFADTVDQIGGMKEFFNMMVDKMAEDEMIRPLSDAQPEEEGLGENDMEEDQTQEDEIGDSDIEFETQNKQSGPQSFQNARK